MAPPPASPLQKKARPGGGILGSAHAPSSSSFWSSRANKSALAFVLFVIVVLAGRELIVQKASTLHILRGRPPSASARRSLTPLFSEFAHKGAPATVLGSPGATLGRPRAAGQRVCALSTLERSSPQVRHSQSSHAGAVHFYDSSVPALADSSGGFESEFEHAFSSTPVRYKSVTSESGRRYDNAVVEVQTRRVSGDRILPLCRIELSPAHLIPAAAAATLAGEPRDEDPSVSSRGQAPPRAHHRRRWFCRFAPRRPVAGERGRSHRD